MVFTEQVLGELGLGYHIEEGEIHFEPEDIKQETATNFDLSFRRFIGDFGYTITFSITTLKTSITNKIRYFFDEEHGLEMAEEVHDDAKAVYQFTSKDAKLYGLEFDVHYQVSPNFSESKW